MQRLVLVSFVSLGFSAQAQAGPKRQVAETFLDAAPDQDTLHEVLAPAPAKDEEGRTEARNARMERINAVEQEFAAAQTDINRAAALYELTKLHGERAFDVRDQAERVYQAEHDRWWIGELAAEPDLKLDGYKDALLKRVNVLRDLAANFPRDPRLAEINWQLASSMARVGNDHSEQYLKQAGMLAKTLEWTNKIKLSRADAAAAHGKWDDALKMYSEVRESIKDATDPLKNYATYRLGWAYLGKANATPGPAGNELTKKGEVALRLAYLGVKEDGDTRFKIKSAAGHDLVWLWAVQDNEKEALAFAEKQDQADLIPEFKDRQAKEWLRQGKLDKAVAYFHDLIAKNPEDVQLPDYHLRIAQAYVTTGNIAAMQAETQALAKLTSDPENVWFGEHKEDQELVGRAKKMVQLLPLAAGFKLFKAATAEKDLKKKKTMLTASVKELETQVRDATDPARALTIRMTLVQALTGLERFPETLDQLDAIVKMGPKAEPYLKDAAFERLKILVKLDGDQKYPPVPEPGDVKTPLPLPALKKRFADAATDYLILVPDAENAVNLKYQIAQDLFTYGHYDKVLPLFEALITTYPKTEQAKAGIETCLSMNLKRKNYAELIRLSTDFLNNRSVKGKVLREYIKQNLDWAKTQTGGAETTAH